MAQAILDRLKAGNDSLQHKLDVEDKASERINHCYQFHQCIVDSAVNVFRAGGYVPPFPILESQKPECPALNGPSVENEGQGSDSDLFYDGLVPADGDLIIRGVTVPIHEYLGPKYTAMIVSTSVMPFGPLPLPSFLSF